MLSITFDSRKGARQTQITLTLNEQETNDLLKLYTVLGSKGTNEQLAHKILCDGIKALLQERKENHDDTDVRIDRPGSEAAEKPTQAIQG